MGVVKEIFLEDGLLRFPEQSDKVGQKVQVCFHYDTSHLIPGTIVRDDLTAPFRMLIALDDGPILLSTECQYTDAR